VLIPSVPWPAITSRPSYGGTKTEDMPGGETGTFNLNLGLVEDHIVGDDPGIKMVDVALFDRGCSSGCTIMHRIV
jgi:hypothetical protein